MKNIFKNLFLITLVCFFTISIVGCKKEEKVETTLLDDIKVRQKIIVGVKFDSKPFGFIDEDQKLKGFDVDVAKELAKRLFGSSKQIEFKQVTSSNRIFSLTSGSVDMIIATMTINDTRKRIVDFSIPYYVAGQAIMVPNDSKVKNIRDLNGKKVIVVLGSTAERNLRALAPNALIQGFRTYTDAYTALKAGRADALTTDDAIISGFLMEDKNYKMLPERYTKEPYAVAFRKSQRTQSLQRAVNILIENMIADGTIRNFEHKWMK